LDDSSDPSAQWFIPSQTKSVAMQNSRRLHRNSVQTCSETINISISFQFGIMLLSNSNNVFNCEAWSYVTNFTLFESLSVTFRWHFFL